MKKWKTAFVILCITCIWCPTAAAQQCWEDADGDGYGDSSAPIACGGGQNEVDNDLDCDDSDADINPGATEIPGNGIDEDCNGLDGQDADGDGYISTATGGDDCNDTDAAINPGATEVCDTIDNDCDGLIDDDDPSIEGAVSWCADSDADGFGDPTNMVTACGQPNGFITDCSDCDDTNATINPGAMEIPGNDIDEDCDGVAQQQCWLDEDGDGFGDPGSPIACDSGQGEVDNDLDCDDSDADINPGATEIPGNGIDEDCNGLDGQDADGDGYISTATGGDDCNDTDAAINPGATEVCDTIDNDCDSLIDDDDDSVADTVRWCADSDNDGFGDPATTVFACGQPAGYVTECSDCDDTNAEIGGGCDAVFEDGFESA